MTEVTIPYRLKFLYKTEAEFDAENPVLLAGEYGVVVDSDPEKRKRGDGVTAWSGLPFQTLPIADGNYGDVTVSDDGDTIEINDEAVTNAKLANMVTARFKGRTTAGTGAPEDLTGTQATALLDTFTGGAKGLVPSSGGGMVNFLRADASFAPVVQSVTGGTGNGVTISAVTSGGNVTITPSLGNISSTSLSTGTIGVTGLLNSTGDVQTSGTLFVGSTASIGGTITFASGTTASAPNMYQNSSGEAPLRSTSSRRYKADIRDLTTADINATLSLRPISYTSISQADKPTERHLGLIAEEVAEIDQRLVHWIDVDGQRVADGVQYERLTVLLLGLLKQERAERASLTGRVLGLEAILSSRGILRL